MNSNIVARDQPMQYVTRLRREGRGGKTNDGHFQSREALTLTGARGGQTAAEGVMGDKRATPFLQQTPTSDVVHRQALADFSPQTMESMAK
ncbi:hypothetical protein [Asaia bogorensis]|uniref:hypothetical protein n=1 Tax=Asaia bogorensis TaxID=91915 RepID=UPI0013CEBB85|nr:hypothetical protein [Asaia bogorensis]